MPSVFDPLRRLAGDTLAAPETIESLRARGVRRSRRRRLVVASSTAFGAVLVGALAIGPLTERDPDTVDTVGPPSSSPSTPPPPPAEATGVAGIAGANVVLVSSTAGVHALDAYEGNPARLVTAQATTIAFGVDAATVVAQLAPGDIVVIDPGGTRPLTTDLTVDAGGTIVLLDVGIVDGQPTALLVTYRGANPEQWEVRLQVVDVATGAVTDGGLIGGWEEGVTAARLLADGVVAQLEFHGGSSLQRRTLSGDLVWEAQDLGGEGTGGDFTGTMTTDADEVVVVEGEYLPDCDCSQVRVQRFDLATGAPTDPESSTGGGAVVLHGDALPPLDGVCSARVEAIGDGALLCSTSYEGGPVIIDQDGRVTTIPGAPQVRDARPTAWKGIADGPPLEDDRPRSQETTEFDHWHATIDAFHCDSYDRLDVPLTDQQGDRVGIHTHADNVIHIHPFTDQAAGRNARLQLFLDDTAVEVTDDSVTFPDGEVWRESDGCAGEPAEVVLAVWNDARTADAGAPPDAIVTEDIGNTRFISDRHAFVLALVPQGGSSELPAPPDVLFRLDNLSDV